MKKLLFYSLFLIVFGLGIAFTLQQGRKLSAETGYRLIATHPPGPAGVGPSASLLTFADYLRARKSLVATST
ncbi:MAG: hypothetical protein ACLQU4_21795 [Limisphaerales bacterium]